MGLNVLSSSRFVTKPWGHEEIFAETDRYVGKLLVVRAGEALSLQYHEHKEETLRLLEGTLELHAGPNRECLEASRSSRAQCSTFLQASSTAWWR